MDKIQDFMYFYSLTQTQDTVKTKNGTEEKE